MLIYFLDTNKSFNLIENIEVVNKDNNRKILSDYNESFDMNANSSVDSISEIEQLQSNVLNSLNYADFMSELVSSVELKKADRNPIKFNFQFENGLPVKPMFEVITDIWMSKKTGEYGITLHLNGSLDIHNFTLENVSFHKTKKESKDIWIHLPECYFIVKDVKNNIVDKMNTDGLGISFIDQNGNQL